MAETEIVIRAASIADEPFLWEMLYQALYVPEGSPPFPREIVRQPELGRYVEGWGRPGDVGLIAESEGRPIGAAWLRRSREGDHGYGYVNDATPELSMAVRPEWRSRGIGSRLLGELLQQAVDRYPAVSLSVSADNPALRLYERHGFEVFRASGGSLTMVRDFTASRSQ